MVLAHAVMRPQAFEMHHWPHAGWMGFRHTVVSSANRTDANLERPRDVPPALTGGSAFDHLRAIEYHRRAADWSVSDSSEEM
jgi:hypothetical protein